MAIHDIRLDGPAIRSERISGPLLSDLLRLIVEGSQRALRFRLEGRSRPSGTPPKWLRDASRFDVLPERDGKAIHLDAPPLLETMRERFEQKELFPALALELSDAIEAVERDGHGAAVHELDLLDPLLEELGVVREGAHQTVVVALALCHAVQSVFEAVFEEVEGGPCRVETPLPQAVRVVGKIDSIRHRDRMLTLVLEGGQVLRGFAEAVDAGALAAMWGKAALVTGMAVFRPSGSVLRIEAEKLSEADDRDAAIWSGMPNPLMAPLDLRKLHVPQGPRSGINAIWGQWPGDESYEEFLAELEEMS